jgi:hypothetical protein
MTIRSSSKDAAAFWRTLELAVAMLQWPMHSTEQPTDPEGDHGRGIGLRLDSGT